MGDGDESLGGSVLKLMFVHYKIVSNALLNRLDFWLLCFFSFFLNNQILNKTERHFFVTLIQKLEVNFSMAYVCIVCKRQELI